MTIPTPEALRHWREARGLTQEQAARLAGSSHYQTWQRWERGERAVPHWLCDVLRARCGSAPEGA